MSEIQQPKKLFQKDIALEALVLAFKKLNPMLLKDNFIMCCVAVGSLIATLQTLFLLFVPSPHISFGFSLHLTLWLWLTVIFGNFAESYAEFRGKAQAQNLKKSRKDTKAIVVDESLKNEREIQASLLKKGDIVVVSAGEVIPADGTVILGLASVDESAITGESAPVLRESGGDRSAVTGGTLVLSDKIYVSISTDPGKSFLDKMISIVEGAKREETPNERALNILLFSLTFIFLISLAALYLYTDKLNIDVPLLFFVAFFVCLIPTTIGGLIPAIGIAGMNRVLQKNVLALSGKAVEVAGDVDVLLLDKTGTITLGNRMASEIFLAPQVSIDEFAEAAWLSSMSDETPEGRSVVKYIQKLGFSFQEPKSFEPIHFSAETRMSGVKIPHLNCEIRKGACDAVQALLTSKSSLPLPPEVTQCVKDISKKGGTPLLVVKNDKILGTIYLKDIVKPGIRARFDRLRLMGIRSVMVTGDNRLTAAAIAQEAGVDDFLAESKPEDKLHFILELKKERHTVAMSGDGTNDAPALATADVGLAMNTGTQSAREAANMIDLDSNPTKIIEVIEVGKQLLITRGSLTTFSILNDIAKYFVILPALFSLSLPHMQKFNVMHLNSPQSSILSAVIFNALIIVFLIPLALKGVSFKTTSTSQILKRNFMIFGVGGITLPFIGIKLIDMLLTFIGAV